jgi:hypothetical protein
VTTAEQLRLTQPHQTDKQVLNTSDSERNPSAITSAKSTPALTIANENEDLEGPSRFNKDAALQFATTQMNAGVGFDKIEKWMVDDGFDPQLASTVIFKLRNDRIDELREASRSYLFYGGIKVVLLAVVTVLTFIFTDGISIPRIFTVVLLIIVGGFQFVHGVNLVRELWTAERSRNAAAIADSEEQ